MAVRCTTCRHYADGIVTSRTGSRSRGFFCFAPEARHHGRVQVNGGVGVGEVVWVCRGDWFAPCP